MRKSNWAKLKWPRVKETAPPAPLWLFCDPFCKSRGQSTCMGELIQKKTRVATIFQWAETHQTFRSRLWVLTNLVSVSETNPNKKQILRRAMLVYIFNPKIYVANFCHYRRYFCHEFREKIATWFSGNEGGVKGRLDLLRQFIRFGRGRLP